MNLNRIKIILTVLACACIISAAAIAAKNFSELKRAEKFSADAAQQLETLILSSQATAEALPSLNPDSLPMKTEAPGSVISSPAPQMDTINISGREYIGMLSVPSLGLELPVISQWSDDALKAAPCRYSGSVFSGDMVIAGHNFPSHFADLNKLSPGDELSFTDAGGREYRYTVAHTEILSATDVEAMCSGESELSLFTCTPGGGERFTVRCSQTDSC